MLNKYKTLIQSLPVNEIGFASKKSVWEKFHDKSEWLKKTNETLFGDKTILTLTRGELKSADKSKREFILKVIYWGYARGMRGNHFENIILEENCTKLENLLNRCNSIDNFEKIFKEVKEINGIAISTFTKFLYFIGANIEGQKALILDAQIINALSISPFKHDDFKELEIRNAHQFYVKYLQKMSEWANDLETEPENVEMFLFMFHKGLNPTKI